MNSDANNAFIASFNMPENLKHDHSKETMDKMSEGIAKLDSLIRDIHPGCVEHVLKYAELNIKFLFIASAIDKDLVKICLDMFIPNIINLFLRKPQE